jgi:hypothetical protein
MPDTAKEREIAAGRRPRAVSIVLCIVRAILGQPVQWRKTEPLFRPLFFWSMFHNSDGLTAETQSKRAQASGRYHTLCNFFRAPACMLGRPGCVLYSRFLQRLNSNLSCFLRLTLRYPERSDRMPALA